MMWKYSYFLFYLCVTKKKYNGTSQTRYCQVKLENPDREDARNLFGTKKIYLIYN